MRRITAGDRAEAARLKTLPGEPPAVSELPPLAGTIGYSDDLIRRAWKESVFQRQAKYPLNTELEYGEYRDKPNEFMEDVLGWKPWGSSDSPTGKSGQREMSAALVDSHRVTVVSANGTGKTAWLARVIQWFQSTRKNAITIVIAPKNEIITTQIFAHIRQSHQEAKQPLPGIPLTKKWEIGPLWFAHGFSTASEVDFQGFHAVSTKMEQESWILVVVDEASGVAPFAFNALRGYLTKGHTYVVFSGNGNFADGPFFDSHDKKGGRWSRFQLSAYDCPEWLIKRDWIEDMEDARDRGEITEDQFRIRVEGGFPLKGSSKQLIPRWILEQCEELKAPTIDEELHIGLDVSRHGSDMNVASATLGGRLVAVESWNTPDLVETANNVKALAESWGMTQTTAYNLHIDIGMGAGVIDELSRQKWQVDTVDFGSGPKGDWSELVGEKQKFRDRKAELFWVGRLLLLKRMASVPKKFKATWKQLMWHQYSFKGEGGDGPLFIEGKKSLAKRGYAESPDFADSWILSLSRQGSGWLAMRI